jgi:hypothetical protein
VCIMILKTAFSLAQPIPEAATPLRLVIEDR